jgi:hypothetical protein
MRGSRSNLENEAMIFNQQNKVALEKNIKFLSPTSIVIEKEIKKKP